MLVQFLYVKQNIRIFQKRNMCFLPLSLVDSSAAQISSPVVIAVVLLACGAIAGYTAYKKKRYCFKPRGKNNCSKSYIFAMMN